jgi:hypothetical protein
VIEKIVLRRNPEADAVPRITGVTCQTSATGDHLEPLPVGTLPAAEEAWIAAHTILRHTPYLAAIRNEIRRAHRLD